MFRRFVRPYCKNLKTQCMFLIILQSSKSRVTSSWYCQICDVCGNMFFTCWRSASYWNSVELVTENLKWDAPSLWVWIGLNCIFILWDTSDVDFKRKKTENDFKLHQTGHWKFKMGFSSTLSMNRAELRF